MKTTLSKGLFLLSIIVCQLGHSQENVFAFAFDEAGQPDDASNTSESYKHQVVQQIFDDLVEAKGVFNMPKPTFELSRSTQMPAYIDLKEAKVVIEEKAYDICTSLGADSLSAISALMAHELTHYYEKHDWRNNFLHFYQSKLIGKNRDAALTYEVQADQLGGFLSNMAGYNTSGVMTPLLKKIYTDYGLSTAANSHYPSLEDRIGLANKSEERLREMSHAFEMSNLLTAVGAYDQAFHYLDFIIKKGGFQSREIYNNQAVLLMLSAISLFSELELPLVMPLEYDFESRLGRRSNKSTRDAILDKAEEILKTSLNLDKDYLPALQNLSSLHILKGNFFEAEYEAKKLLLFQSSEDDKYHQAQAEINLSIIDYLQGNKEDALNHINEAEKLHNSPLVIFNKNIISGQGELNKSSKVKSNTTSSQSMGLNKLFSKLMRDELSASDEIEIDSKNMFFKVQNKGHEVFVNMNDFGEGGCHFFQQRTECTIDNQTFELTTNRSDIEKIIGNPNQTFSSGKQTVCHYPSNQLIVRYNDQAYPISFVHYHEER